MVIVASKVGRLCNRLLLFAHLIGTAVEHGFRIVNPAFASCARYFPSLSDDLLCRFPKAGRPIPPGVEFVRELLYGGTYVAARAMHALPTAGLGIDVMRIPLDQSVDLDGEKFLSAVRTQRSVWVHGWMFRSAENTEKHADLIRDFFRPHARHWDRPRALVETARKRNRFLVGVHVRQGDYATFKGGSYLYSHREYGRVMERVERAFGRENVSFLVTSDAPVPPGAFVGHDILHGSGQEIEDLYALSECDRVIGPPSTYSKWASFFGSTPRCEIADPEQQIEREDFQVESRLVHDWIPPRVMVPGAP